MSATVAGWRVLIGCTSLNLTARYSSMTRLSSETKERQRRIHFWFALTVSRTVLLLTLFSIFGTNTKQDCCRFAFFRLDPLLPLLRVCYTGFTLSNFIPTALLMYVYCKSMSCLS
ncbi:unnamed protein product [Ixodes pacificus]